MNPKKRGGKLGQGPNGSKASNLKGKTLVTASINKNTLPFKQIKKPIEKLPLPTPMSEKQGSPLIEYLKSNFVMTMIIITIFVFGVLLLIFQIANYKPISPSKLLESSGIFFVILGTLWAALGVYLTKDSYQAVRKLVNAKGIQTQDIRAIGQIFEDASKYCIAGMVIVFVGGLITMICFVANALESNRSAKEIELKISEGISGEIKNMRLDEKIADGVKLEVGALFENRKSRLVCYNDDKLRDKIKRKKQKNGSKQYLLCEDNYPSSP